MDKLDCATHGCQLWLSCVVQPSLPMPLALWSKLTESARDLPRSRVAVASTTSTRHGEISQRLRTPGIAARLPAEIARHTPRRGAGLQAAPQHREHLLAARCAMRHASTILQSPAPAQVAHCCTTATATAIVLARLTHARALAARLVRRQRRVPAGSGGHSARDPSCARDMSCLEVRVLFFL